MNYPRDPNPPPVRTEPYVGPPGRCEHCWTVLHRRVPGTTAVILDEDDGRWMLACDQHAQVFAELVDGGAQEPPPDP